MSHSRYGHARLIAGTASLCLGAIFAQTPNAYQLTALMWTLWLSGVAVCFALGREALPGLALLFVVLSVYVVPATYHSFARITLFAGYDFTSGHTVAEVLVMLGITGLVFGTIGGAIGGHVSRERGDDPAGGSASWVRASRSRQAMIPFGLLLVGAVALYLFGRLAGADLTALNIFAEDVIYGDFQRGATGPRYQLLNTLASVAGAAAILSALIAGESLYRRRLGMMLWSSSLFILAVAFLSLGGQRQRLIVPLIAMAFLFAARSRTRTGSFWSVAVFASAVAAAIHVIGDARSSVRSAEPEGRTTVAELAQNQDLFAPLAGLVDSVPERVDYLFGLSYAEFVVMPIPRTWFTSKPTGSIIEVQSSYLPAGIGASSGQFGELYANFGWAGVLVGSTLLGWCITRIWRNCLRLCSVNRQHPRILVAVAAVAVLLQVATRSNAATQTFGQLGFMAGIVAGAYLISIRPPRSPSAQNPLYSVKGWRDG
jgi:oligosaccharide repeat unit polymerase